MGFLTQKTIGRLGRVVELIICKLHSIGTL